MRWNYALMDINPVFPGLEKLLFLLLLSSLLIIIIIIIIIIILYMPLILKIKGNQLFSTVWPVSLMSNIRLLCGIVYFLFSYIWVKSTKWIKLSCLFYFRSTVFTRHKLVTSFQQAIISYSFKSRVTKENLKTTYNNSIFMTKDRNLKSTHFDKKYKKSWAEFEPLNSKYNISTRIQVH